MIKLKGILTEGNAELSDDTWGQLRHKKPLLRRSVVAYEGWTKHKNRGFKKLDDIYRALLQLERVIGSNVHIMKIASNYEKEFLKELKKTYKDPDKIWAKVK